MEKEITSPVDMCRPDGHLNPSAVGWSRFPRHNTNLHGFSGRNKRFDYWCVASPKIVVAFSVSDIDYRSGVATFFLDRTTKSSFSTGQARWFRPNPTMRVPWGTRAIEDHGEVLSVLIEPRGNEIALSLRSQRLTIDITVNLAEEHESMGVLVPWSSRTFQYTRKVNCLTARGTVTADGTSYELDPGTTLATLDHGRGRWPYNTLWNWASASGETDGHHIGLQFGGKWTVGTPSTENSVRINGRVEKISEELHWTYDTNDWMAPWRITGSTVDFTFHPEYHRHSKMDRGVLLAREDQVFGSFTGDITSHDGHTYRVDDLFGWAEEVHRRW